MKALAVICAFNEADIIGWTVRHLIRQGLEVYVIDSGSTDDTVETAVGAGATVEHYPTLANGHVSWRALLTHVEQVAEFQIGRYDWVMHCDADEIRRNTINPQSRDARNLNVIFEQASVDGYNAVQFKVYTFHPIDNGFDGTQDPEQYFRYYTRDAMNERIGQVKAWKNDLPVRIAWSGGHRMKYAAGKLDRISPLKLISKHYPIRSQAHGERKVFQERRGRWSDPEKDWHVQYAGIEPGHNFLRDPKDLLLWSGA